METLAQAWTREGMEKGLQQGMKQGMQQGMMQTLEVVRPFTVRLLRSRFADVGQQTVERLDSLTLEQIKALGDVVLDFNSASELEEWLEKNCS